MIRATFFDAERAELFPFFTLPAWILLACGLAPFVFIRVHSWLPSPFPGSFAKITVHHLFIRGYLRFEILLLTNQQSPITQCSDFDQTCSDFCSDFDLKNPSVLPTL